jgi:hypothetical protein
VSSGAAASAGTTGGFGLASGFFLVGGFFRAGGLGVAVTLGAAAGWGTAIGLRAILVLRLALGFCAGLGADFATGGAARARPELLRAADAFTERLRDAARGAALDFERRAFGRFRFDCLVLGGFAFAASGRAFAPIIFLGDVSGLRARSFKAACAALALFLACLAIFLPIFANFRARFRTCLAARSACFSALARAAALFDSTLNRWAEAAWVADVAEEEVATAISFL